MKIYTRITVDMNTLEVLTADYFEYDGPVAECKGDTTARDAERSQFQFTQLLQSVFAQQFGAQRDVLNFLNGKLTSMVNNPTGFSPEALAAMKTNAIQQTATDYSNASRAVNNQIAARGGSTLPNGVNAQIAGQLAAEGANEETSTLNNIQLANEQQKQNNYWNAISGLSGVASQFNPAAFGSEVNSGGGTIAGLSQAVTQANNSGWFHQFMGGLGSGLGAGLGAFATGGLSKATGWGYNPQPPSNNQGGGQGG